MDSLGAYRLQLGHIDPGELVQLPGFVVVRADLRQRPESPRKDGESPDPLAVRASLLVAVMLTRAGRLPVRA